MTFWKIPFSLNWPEPHWLILKCNLKPASDKIDKTVLLYATASCKLGREIKCINSITKYSFRIYYVWAL
jgi:hypothetical protein